MTKRNESDLISAGLDTSEQKEEGNSAVQASDARFGTSRTTFPQKRTLWAAPRLEKLGSVNDTTLPTLGTNPLG